jgi:hypothetical protein
MAGKGLVVAGKRRNLPRKDWHSPSLLHGCGYGALLVFPDTHLRESERILRIAVVTARLPAL